MKPENRNGLKTGMEIGKQEKMDKQENGKWKFENR
jgi:hypothetical protein